MKRIHTSPFLLILASALIFVSACRNQGSTPEVSTPSAAPPTKTPLATVGTIALTATATYTPETTPTHTAAPAASPTPSPIPSETPEPEYYAVIAVPIAYVRAGPAEIFEPFMQLGAGVRVRVLGQEESGSWFLIDLGVGQTGWISQIALSFDVESDISVLVIVPTPELPTLTPTAAAVARIFLSFNPMGELIYEIIDFPATEDVIVQVFGPDGSLSIDLKRDTNFQGYYRGHVGTRYLPDSGRVTVVVTSASGVTAQNSILIP